MQCTTSYLTILIVLLGLVALVGSFINMKKGFGPYNLRVVGTILIVTILGVLLSENISEYKNAAIGILGALAGNIFSIQPNKE